MVCGHNMEEVVKAVEGLKMNKAAGCNGLQPKHVKYRGCGLTLYLSTAFTMFFVIPLFLSSLLQPMWYK